MSIQGQFNQTLGVVAAALSIFKGKEEKKPSVIDDDLKKAKTEYYKQKTKSAKLNDKYTKEATKFRKSRANYWDSKTNLNNLKADELKAKTEQIRTKANLDNFGKAINSSLQEISKKLDNKNLILEQLGKITANKTQPISTDGTTTNIATTEEIKALEAKQQREWTAHINRSNAAKKVWEVKKDIRNLEDIDAQWNFSGDFKAEDLKKIGLNKTKLREMDKSGEFEKAQDALAEHFKGTETEAAILGAQDHAELGKILENEIYRKDARKAEEEEYWEARFAEAENQVKTIQNKQEVKEEKEETYSVWPKRNFNINTEEKKDFNEMRWRR